MVPEAEHEANPELPGNIPEERIVGKFSRPRRERPMRKRESSLVTKTGHPSGHPSWGLCGGRGR